jgi:hypothetical protein
MFMVGENPPPGFFAVFAQFPRNLFLPSGDRSKDPGKRSILLLLEQVAVEM